MRQALAPRSWLPLCLAPLTQSNGKPLGHVWCWYMAPSLVQHCHPFGRPAWMNAARMNERVRDRANERVRKRA